MCSLRMIAVLAVLLFWLPSPGAAQAQRRDGNRWRDRSNVERQYVIIGLSEGVALGHRLSYWGSIEKGELETFRRVDSFDAYTDKYMRNVRSDQLVDGLDVFFDDFQNRRILVADAVWLVLNGIAGTPRDQLDKMIESYRRNIGP